jgi:ectoine hydroxylase-related dioxygenase (phytanoyl-CoA dioxygenase family)
VAAYRRDGFLFPLPALVPEEVAAARDWLATFERRHASVPAKERRETLLRFKPHLLHPELDRIVRHPRILDAVTAVIGSDVLVWSSAFFIKDTRDPAFVSWHQDSLTYGLDGDELLSAWIALTDVDAGNGAMRFAPGSHRAGLVRHRLVADHRNLVSLGETIDGVDETAAVRIELRAGEMSLHNIHLMHASDPNASDRPRIGFVVRYMPPAMRPRGGPASALLVCGQDRHGHFEPEAPPLAADDPATIARHERALALRRARTFAAEEV